MIVSRQSTAFEAVHNEGETGLVGTIEVRIDDNDGATVLGPTSAGIIELGATGVYSAELIAPGIDGQFSVLWSPDGSFDDETTSVDDLLVSETAVSGLPPLVPSEGTGPGVGPCSAWTTAEAVAVCCGNEDSSDDSIYDDVAIEASQVMYELSARKFAGLCERKVRPQPHGDGCACGRAAPVVRLAGRPIRSIVEVKIDGDIVDADTYQLTRKGLMRVRDLADPTTRLYWPCSQDLDLPDTEEGTFSIRYLHGMDPPALGQRAADELACELYRACPGSSGTCLLPAGVVRLVRANATIEMRPFVNWGYDQKRGWETGMKLVDLFLNTYNRDGHRRRPAVWSPDVPRYPQAEPIAGS